MIIIEVFKIFGSVFLQTDEADKALDKTNKNAESFASKLGSMVGTAAKVGAGIAVGVGAGATALMGLSNNAAETADKWDKLSERTGIGVENLQRWGYAASQSGADIGKLEVGMKTLSGYMDDAINGNKKATEAFAKLGISIDDLKNKSQEEIFENVMNSLGDMEQGAQRNAVGADLLGKSYTELLPLLNAGSKGMDELKNRADELGLVLSEDAVSAGVVFGDTLADVKDSFGAIVAKIGVEVMPIIQKFLDWVLSNMPMIQSVFQKVVDVIANLVDSVLPILLDMFNYFAENILPPLIGLLSEIITAILPVLKQLFEVFNKSILPVFNKLFDIIVKDILPALIDLFNVIVAELLPPLIELFDVIIAEILPILIDLFSDLIKDVLPILVDIIKEFVIPVLKVLITTLTDLLKYVLPPLTAAIKFLADTIFNELKRQLEALKPVLDNVRGYFENLMGFIKNVFTGNWKGAWENIVAMFSNIWGGIANIAKTPINNMIAMLNKFISGVNKIQIPDWVPELGGKGLNIPKIPMLAEGGNIVSGGMAIVGEAGPELLNLPKGASITPLDKAGITNNFNIAELVVREDADIQRIARELYNLQQKSSFAGAY